MQQRSLVWEANVAYYRWDTESVCLLHLLGWNWEVETGLGCCWKNFWSNRLTLRCGLPIRCFAFRPWAATKTAQRPQWRTGKKECERNASHPVLLKVMLKKYGQYVQTTQVNGTYAKSFSDNRQESFYLRKKPWSGSLKAINLWCVYQYILICLPTVYLVAQWVFVQYTLELVEELVEGPLSWTSILTRDAVTHVLMFASQKYWWALL